MTTGGRAPRTLPELRERLADCRRCAAWLAPEVRPVLSTARDPRAMLIGQAPGQTERESRRSFAGRAGKTLFRWLLEAGVTEETFRAQVHIAAITRCYPGPHPAGRGDRVPSRAEQANCRPWLDLELAIVRPRLVIPVGRMAMNLVLGPRPLDELVGRVHEVSLPHGPVRAVPLPHPSGASSWLNPPEHKRLLARALAHLGRELEALGIDGVAEAAA